MRALVLAAHGSSTNRDACAAVRRLETVLRHEGRFDEVTAAFHRSQPSWSRVLDSLRSEEVVVVPMMAGSGYFCENVLPQEMVLTDRAWDRGERAVRLTPPVGSHLGMPALIARLVDEDLVRLDWAAERSAVVLVGHGTGRHPQSGGTALAHARALKALLPLGDVAAVFLDQQPLIESAFELLSQSQLVVVPFLIGGGEHVVADIPSRLALSIGEGFGSAVCTTDSRRRIAITASPFEQPVLKDMVLDLADAAFADLKVPV